MSLTTPEPWLDKRGIAEHFSCSVRSIELEMAKGLPYAVIFGRPKFLVSEVLAWLEFHGKVDRQGNRITLLATDDRSAAA